MLARVIVYAHTMLVSAKGTVLIAFRVPLEWLERADNLAEALAPPGSSFGRTDAFRAAIIKGFESLEGGEDKDEWDPSHGELEYLDKQIREKEATAKKAGMKRTTVKKVGMRKGKRK